MAAADAADAADDAVPVDAGVHFSGGWIRGTTLYWDPLPHQRYPELNDLGKDVLGAVTTVVISAPGFPFMGSVLPSVTRIRFWTTTTDQGVKNAADSFPGLAVVWMRQCHRITDRALIALADGCDGLQEVYAEYCDNLTDVAIVALADSCAWLEIVMTMGCVHITPAVRQEVESSLKLREKPPPRPDGWWLEDLVPAPSLKGHMN